MLKRLIAFFLVIALASCAIKEQDKEYVVDKIKRDPIDREQNLTRDEFRHGLRPYDSPSAQEYYKDNHIGYNASAHRHNNAPLDFESRHAPTKLPIKNNRKITLSVTEDVPLRDLLLQIARLADLELALDPEIKGGIILSVKQRPVSDVIEMIADLGSLRYRIEKGILHISRDRPYLENYKVDFINLVRSSKGKINSQTKVLSIDSGEEDNNFDAFSSGSSSEISSEYDGDLWKSIESNLEAILQTRSQSLIAFEQAAKLNDQTVSEFLTDNPDQSAVNSAESLANSAVLQQIQSRNTGRSEGGASVMQKLAELEQARSYYSINRQAGIISIMTTQKKHKEVKKYIDKVKISLTTQVLIEAKLIEVSLFDRYGAGINWRELRGDKWNGRNIVAGLDMGDNITQEFTQGVFRFERESQNGLGSTLEMIEEFGTTRTISNPRLTVANNQQAVMTFAKNQPYFTVEGTLQQQNLNANNGVVTQPVSVTSNLRTIPIGLILSLHPSVNLETKEITLNIRPTLSRQSSEATVKDPAITILNNSLSGLNNQEVEDAGIPVVEVRELDTVLTIKSGDIMVLGGLIEHLDATDDIGLPFFSRLPILGNLGKHSKKKSAVRETVILLQATIIPSSGYYHQHDKKMYNRFSQDPLPFDL